ncbi:MAG: ABC transporter ATP-binding protein [Caulobacteraceae bacterium]|nr:MAG: ABC transporter ATP-binding protein [Caulobacteraceae bacterium]
MSGPVNNRTTREPAILVRGLSHRYPRAAREALSGIDLSIGRGTCFGLLGPNGAGKSTLISLMTGMIAPQSGEILVDGVSAAADPRALRRAGALAPQDFAFYPALSGADNLAYFAGLYRIPKADWPARRAAAVAATQLGDWLDRPAETYSGGLKRRLNLAIALINAPRILYLDEPTVGIDARSRQTILDAIKALKADGVTIVYTSHYMEEVEQLCDAVAVIDHGRLVLQGRTAELLSDAAARRLTVTLAAPATARARTALKALSPDWSTPGRVDLDLAAQADLPGVLTQLQAAGLKVARAEYGVSRLETLYLGLLDQAAAEASA